MSNAPLPEGYLALPVKGQGRPVLVLHAWWGLNADIKAFCRRLAGEGFVAFAPDLYHGRVAETVADAESLGQALDAQYLQAKAEIAAAAAYLDEGAGVAVVAFSLGAYYGLDLSNSAPERVHSVVIYYGSGAEEFGASRATYLGHFAADDPYEPAENVQALAQLLEEAGRPANLHVYPGTGHWFCEPGVTQAYDAAAAELAWERTVAFLRER